MDNILDAFDWKDIDMIRGVMEEFTDDEMEFLKFEKDNDEWKNVDIDDFNENDFEI